MTKIHTLNIRNFRSLNQFSATLYKKNFLCIIGRGDSGKSTILEAISAVLSPSWNLNFSDTDFYNADISNPIEIEAYLYDLPTALMTDGKFGLYKQFVKMNGEIVADAFDPEIDEDQEILKIRLTVDKELEPKWEIISDRPSKEPIEIRASDRGKFNVFPITDYLDRHFSWNKGSPLFSLLNSNDPSPDEVDVISSAFREAKEKIDSNSFRKLDELSKTIKSSAVKLGSSIDEISTEIDIRDLLLKDGRISLHDKSIPFRQKGKGSKRLVSVAIQLELAKEGGILLIDEIEQGLEPDRAQHLAKHLKQKPDWQTIITTHSRDVVVELNFSDLAKIKKNSSNLLQLDESLQGCIRANPEALFAKRIVVCEGATEIGICRAINSYLISLGEESAATRGIRFADGTGSSFVQYAGGLHQAGYDVCVFCDSDDPNINKKKESIRSKGINVFDCAESNAIENQVFADVDWDTILKLVKYREITHDGLDNQLQIIGGFVDLSPDWRSHESPQVRLALGKMAKQQEWFKRQDKGEYLGAILCETLPTFQDSKMHNQMTKLIQWIRLG